MSALCVFPLELVAAVRTAEVLPLWKRLDGFLGPLLYRDATTHPDLYLKDSMHVDVRMANLFSKSS